MDEHDLGNEQCTVYNGLKTIVINSNIKTMLIGMLNDLNKQIDSKKKIDGSIRVDSPQRHNLNGARGGAWASRDRLLDRERQPLYESDGLKGVIQLVIANV